MNALSRNVVLISLLTLLIIPLLRIGATVRAAPAKQTDNPLPTATIQPEAQNPPSDPAAPIGSADANMGNEKNIVILDKKDSAPSSGSLIAAEPNQINVYLPLITFPAPPATMQWTGTTNRGQPVSFSTSDDGTQWLNFTLKTDFVIGICSGTIETTISSGSLVQNQLSYTSSSYSFAGNLTSPTTASGSYQYNSRMIPGCGVLTQSGTWTATRS